jgi:hypothetical protein
MPNLTAATQYLFQQIQADPLALAPHQLLARNGRRLRELIVHWWNGLEPEATAGISASMMEQALVACAEKASENKHTFGRRWARSSFNWKPGFIQTGAEQIIGDRFLTTSARLGLLELSRSDDARFAHHTLEELYLGVGLLEKKTIPSLLIAASRIDARPVETPRARAVLAALSIAGGGERDAYFVRVARQNLHVAAWFLYCDDDARRERGAWLASELLGEMTWERRDDERHSLAAAMASLGDSALVACRALLDERTATLPAFLAAIYYVSTHGDAGDLPRLRALLDEPLLGQWEIEQLRQLLREAQPLVVDEEAQKRYTRQEKMELAKAAAVLIVKIAATVALKTTEPLPLSSETAVSVTAVVLDGAADVVLEMSGPEFFQQQVVLREILARIPGVIAKRKVEILEFSPRMREALRSTIATIERRS